MVLKRPLGEGEGDGYESRNHKGKQRIVSSKSDFARNVMHGLSPQDLAATLEPLIRGWVREEVQRACQSFCCSSPRSPFNALEPCGMTSLQLRFQTKLPQMLFTGSKLESENNGAVKVVLFDTNTNEIVSSGPLSSSKLQIVPLDGDFSAGDDEDWSQKDFEARIIHARDGKRPLVAGDLVVVLKDGVGELGEVFFTDNSSWRRSRTFRLGARVISGERIREAISEPFMVKDHRGESYKKHHPPALDDDIWRLEKIAKDGAFHRRLGSHGILTVKHFMQMYITNESSLRKPLVESLKQQIYKSLDGMLPKDDLSVFGTPILTSGLLGGPHRSGGNLLLQNVNIPPLLQDPQQLQLVSPPYMYGADNSTPSEMYIPDDSLMPFFSPALRNSFIFKDFVNGPYGEGSSSGSRMVSDELGPAFDYQAGASYQGSMNTVSSE